MSNYASGGTLVCQAFNEATNLLEEVEDDLSRVWSYLVHCQKGGRKGAVVKDSWFLTEIDKITNSWKCLCCRQT